MNETWYIDECNRQLNDTKFYQHLSEDITADIQKRVTVYVNRIIMTSLSTTKPNNTLQRLTKNQDIFTFYKST